MELQDEQIASFLRGKGYKVELNGRREVSPVVALSDSIKVDTNVPLAPDARGKHFGQRRTRVYPYDKMQVGNSFAVPTNKANHQKIQSTLSSTSRLWAKTYCPTAKFTTRTIGNSVRIWRVA